MVCGPEEQQIWTAAEKKILGKIKGGRERMTRERRKKEKRKKGRKERRKGGRKKLHS